MSRRHPDVQLLQPIEEVGCLVTDTAPDSAGTLKALEEHGRQLCRHGMPELGNDALRFASSLRMDLQRFLTWMSEAEAAEYTGHATAWLRSHFPEMEKAGQARVRAGKREYRQIALLAQRPDERLAVARARAAARLQLDRVEAA